MPIKTVATTVRPNESAPFYAFTEEQRTHFANTYENTGKMTRSVEKSPDQLTRVVERTFPTEADYESFKADPVTQAVKTARQTYNNANSHSTSFTVELV